VVDPDSIIVAYANNLCSMLNPVVLALGDSFLKAGPGKGARVADLG